MDLENQTRMMEEEHSSHHNEPEMSDLIAETNELYRGVEDDTDLSDKIEQGVEQMEELSLVTQVATESAPLSAQAMRMVAIVVKQSTGEDVIGTNLMGMENVVDDSRYQTNIALESIRETLRAFYQAVKRTFYSIWAKIKDWYIKVASLRASIERKAKELIDKASEVTGTANTASFDFARANALHNGKKLSYQTLLPSFDILIKFTNQSLNVKRDTDFENFISTAEEMVKKLVTAMDGGDDTELLKFSSLYAPAPSVSTSDITDEALKKIYQDEDNNTLTITKAFPGDFAAIISRPNEKMSDPINFVRQCWIRLAPNTAKHSNVDSVSVKTLYPTQVAKFGEMVLESCDSILFFDKAWQRRDKFMNKIFKELDKQVDEIDKGLTDSSADAAKEEIAKKLIRSTIAAIKRNNTFNTNLINYNLKVCAAVLELGRACLNQYK